MTISELNNYDNAAYIFNYYAPGCLNKKTVISPISKDKRPSFSVFNSSKYGKLLFKDHRGDKGDCLGLIQLIEKVDAKEALKIAEKLVGNPANKKTKIPTELEFKTTLRSNIIIDIGFEEFKRNDIDWFAKHMISMDIIEKEPIKNISYYNTAYFNKISTPQRRMFFYDYSHYEKDAYKIYETNPKSFLAYYQNGNEIIDGLIEIRQLFINNGKLPYVILIHGKKNYLVLKSLGYNVVARQSETAPSVSIEILNELKSYTNNLILFADNDLDKIENWGIGMADDMKIGYGVNYVTYPDEICLLAKDSDIAGIAKYLYLKNRKNEIHDIIGNMLIDNNQLK